MRRYKSIARAAAALVVAATMAPAFAVPTIDGTASPGDGYGAAKSVQMTKTQFGDNNSGDLIDTEAGGSEIDQVFAVVSGGRLYVTVTGNLENNFNKLAIYLDTKAGGVHEIEETALPDQVDGFCCGGNAPGDGALQRHDGLIFDQGFDADYFLAFTHGNENLNGLGFWALSAHYADLTNGVDGEVVAAGMQLGPQGRPVVLRFPFNSDFDSDADSDGADFLTWQQNLGTATGATRATGDANGDMAVTGDDLAQWQGEFGVERQFSDFPFQPNNAQRTTALIGPTLPNLAQGELIDKDYVTANGLVAPELDFVTAANRNMENTIDLEVALDNSNVAGVEGGQAAPWLATGDASAVFTGLEFSIPLSEIGSPTGDIKLTAFVTSGDYDYASNQFSGAGINDRNPGGDGIGGDTGDLQGVILDDTLHNPGGNVFAYLGEQFVTVQNPLEVLAASAVPEPGTAVLAAVAALGMVASARRRG